MTTKKNEKNETLNSPVDKNKNQRPKKIKRRLFSRLNINIPIAPSLMLILPSFSEKSDPDTSLTADESVANKPISDTSDLAPKHDNPTVIKDSQVKNNEPHQATSENHTPIENQVHSSHHLSDRSFAITTHIQGGMPPSSNISNNNNPIPLSPLQLLHATNYSPQKQTMVNYTAEVIPGKYGNLTVDKSGKYTFTLNPNSPEYINLQSKEPATDTFIMHLSNGMEVTVHVPLQGKQDNPTITGDLSGVLTEDLDVDGNGLIKSLGKIEVIDADHDQSGIQAETIKGQYGTLSINQNGHWQYLVDNRQSTIQALTSKTSLSESFTVHTTDGTAQTIQMTIGGENDNALISGVDDGITTEETQLQTRGTLSITDVDSGEAHFSNTDIVGSLGTLHLTDSGAWTYDLDNANPTVQALGQGENTTDIITVHSADGTPHQISITVNGTNDSAVISGTNSGAVTEESQLQTSGKLIVTDVDSGEEHFSNTDIVGALGTLHLTDSGSWTYDLDNTNPTVQALGQGSNTTDIITVHSADGTPHQISITVNGTNDKAIISGASTGQVTEESQLQTSGKLIVTDVDSGEEHFSNTDIVGALGTLHLTDSGSWTYDLDNTNPTVQALGQGENTTDIITVHSADGTPHQITITVNGTNDKAVIAGTSTASLTEDKDVQAGQLRVDGALNVTDVDNGQAQFQSESLQGQFGSLSINNQGHWTYIADNSQPTIQGLKTGESITDTVLVHSVDGTSQQVTVTINGTDDKAIIGGVDTGDITENSAGINMSPDHAHSGMATLGQSVLYASGQLNIFDPDKDESAFGGQSSSGYNYHGSYGDLILNKDGSWNYHADLGHVSHIGGRPTTRGTAIDKLGEGQSLTDTITIHSKDGTTHDIVITIHGSNDRPYCSSEVQLNSGKEDIAQTLTTSDLLANTVDVDANDAGKLSIENLVADHGSLLDNKDGTFTFTPEKDYNGQVHFNYDVKDAHGGITHTGASTTLAAVGDAAIISGVDTGSVTENTAGKDMSPDQAHAGMSHLTGAMLYADGKLSISDPDTGENKFDTNQGGAQGYTYHGSYGRLILNADGGWHYNVNAGSQHNGPMPGTAGTAIDKLGDGDSLTDTITVRAIDGTTHDIVITIHGSNDRPYCSSEVTLNAGTEDKQIILTASDLLANTVDVDANDAGKLSIENLHVDHGSISANTDGSFTFSPAKDYNGAVHFTYDVKDGHGGVTHTGASTSLSAVNDTSQLDSHLAVGEITEDNTSRPMSNDLKSQWTNLDTIDVDSSAEANIVQIEINGVVHQVPSDFAMNLQGNHGAFVTTHSTDGHNKWHYVADNSHNEIQGLKDGQSLTDSMTLITADGTRIPITATIRGVDDQVVIDTPASTVASLGTVVEDSTTSVTGMLLAHDSDTDDTVHFQAQATTGAYGTLTVNKDGSWHYDLDHAKANSLGASDTKAEGFDVVAISSDGSTATQHIEVIVQGSDDLAVITGTHTAAVSEGDIGDNVTATGTLSITDVDTGDTPSFPDIASIATTYGHITMHNGQWTYNLDESKVQQLDPDEAAVIDHHTFTASDGSKQTVDITISGTNDKPVIESAHAAPAGASITLKLQDVAIIDSPTGANIDVAPSNAENAQRWGTDQVGVASGVKLVGLYKPGSDHNWITHPATTSTGHSGAGGYNRVDSHDWWQNNGIPDTVNTGSGGASGHGNAWTGGIAVFEDSAGHQTIGIINRVCSGSGSEVDYLYYHTYQHLQVGSAQFSGSATAGETINVMDGNSKIASVVADSNGHWEVAANNLSDGQHTLHIENGAGQHSAEMVLQVAGHSVQNITPAGLTPELKEDSAQTTIDGELRSTDVDHGDTASIIAQSNHTTKYGHFSIDANGQYHYTVDNSNQDVNHLGVHQTLTEVIPVTSTSTDGTSVTTNVTITIQGSVDQPILNATAPDAQQGTSMALNLNVAASDTGGDHEDLLIKISGLPDAATLNHGTHDTIAKLWTLHQSDLAGLELNLHDGSFHGDLHFNVTATASAGGESESITKAVTLFVNAPPEVASAVTGSKTEDSGMGAIDLLAGATDADTSDTLSLDKITYQLAGQAKTTTIPSYLTMGKDGHTLVINTNAPAFQHLATGDTQTITMSYNVKDTHGGSIQQTATVTITGTNDSAVISGQATGSVIEDNPATASGTLTISDSDDNQSSFNVATVTGTYGTLTIGAHGVWQYSLSTSGASGDKVQALPDGQKVTDTLQVQSVDGTVHNISIGVTGANDQPTVTVQALNATEDSDFQFTLSNFGFTDTDTGDSLDHITLTALPDATQGELLLNGVAVSVNQQIANADIAQLTFKPVANFNGDVHLSYSVNDGHNDSAPATTTLAVANVNDLPTVVATTQSTLEDTDIVITQAQLLSGSADANLSDVLNINSVSVNGGHGTVTDNGNGTWTLHPDTNFKGDITLNYHVNDGTVNVDNHMTVRVSTVTDQANIGLVTTVQQEIITTGTAGRIQIDNIQAAAPLTEMTLEMTVIGKAVADTGGGTGPVVVNMGQGVHANTLSLWNPGNMKIGGAGNIATGINLSDGGSHRVTLTWDSTSGDLKVFDNGALAATAHNFHKGGTLPADMFMVLGSKANGGIANPSWHTGEHYEGSIFNTAIASHALTPAQVALGPLASQLNVHTGLLADVRSIAGSIQDTTGTHTLAENGVGHEMHTVDTKVGTPPAGSLVNLHPTVTSPDGDDKITDITINGLVKGAVISDGVHTHTMTGIHDTISIKDWDMSHLKTQLPPAVTRNMNIGITATTLGPDGQVAVVTEYTGLKLDPTRPIPNAIIGGDDTNEVTEDLNETAGFITSNEHILTIQDTDAGDNHFLASGEKVGSTVASGAWVAGDHGLGEFKLDANGHWLYRASNSKTEIQELKTGDTLSETLTVYSTDGTPHELSATIKGTDDIPTITPQSLSEAEDTSHTFSASEFGFADVDKGDTLAHIMVTALPDVSQGQLLLNGVAVTANQNIDAADIPHLVFVPTKDFNGDATFNYTVSDGSNNSAAGTATLTISAVNDAPIMVASTAEHTAEEDRQITGSITATDVDTGDSLTFTTTATVAGFALKSDGSYTFDPSDASYNTMAKGDSKVLTIPVTVSDGHGGTAVQNLVINLAGTNDAPTVSVASLSGTEDTNYTFTAANFGFTDVDATDALDHVTITSLPSATEGQLLLNGVAVTANQQIANADIAKLVFTPVANFNGDVHFNYTVSDGTADSASAQATIAVSSVVDAASISTSAAPSGDEDTAIALNLNVSEQGDTLDHVTITGFPTGSVFSAGHTDGNTGWVVEKADVAALKITPPLNHEADLALHVVATTTDGSTTADSGTFDLAVTVNAINDAASFAGTDSGSVTEDKTNTGAHTVQGNLVVIDPDSGQDSFTTKYDCVSDPFNLSGNGFGISSTGSWMYDALDNTVAMQSLAEGQTVQVQYRVYTEGGDSHLICIDVHGTNDAPTLLATGFAHTDGRVAPIVATEDQAIDIPLSKFLLLTKDVDQGAVLHISNLTTDHGSATISSDGQTIHYTPELNYHGNVTFQYNAVDEHGGQVHTGVIMPVNAVNDIPTIATANLNGTEDIEYQFTAANFGFKDVDTGDSLDHVTITTLPQASEGQLLLNGVTVAANQDISAADIPHLTFKPAANFNGDVQFGYSVNDGHADSATAQVNLHIDNVVDTPTLSISDTTGIEDHAIALTLTGTAKTDDHIAEYVITGVPKGAQLSAGHNDGSGQWTVSAAQAAGLTITPASNFSGDMQLQVTATTSDGSHTADSSTQALTVHVSPDADMPVINAFDVNGTSSIATAAGPASLSQVITMTQDMVDAIQAQFSDHSITGDLQRGYLVLEHATWNDVESLTVGGTSVDMRFFAAFGIDKRDPHIHHVVGPEHVGPMSLIPFYNLKVGDQIELTFQSGVDPTTNLSVLQLNDTSANHLSTGSKSVDFSHLQNPVSFFDSLQAPAHMPTALTLHEDGDINLSVDVGSPDSSETLEVRVEGLPVGAMLNHGTLQSDGSWLVSSGDANALVASMPLNYHGGLDVSVTAISHDGTSTTESAPMIRHIDVASVTDQASLTTGDLTVDEHQTTWQDLPVNALEGDSQDPISAVTISNLSPLFELRLAPGTSGNSPVHNADGTWSIDPQTVSHLQVHTDDHDGAQSVYQVSVTTTGPDGVKAEIIHSGHVTYNAVIDSSVTLESGLSGTQSSDVFGQVTTVDISASGTLQHIGELLNFQENDSDETTMLYVRVADGIHIYRPSGTATYPISDDMRTDSNGITADRDPGFTTFLVPASEIGQASIMNSGTAITGADIRVRVYSEEGTGVTGARSTETFHFTGASVSPIGSHGASGTAGPSMTPHSGPDGSGGTTSGAQGAVDNPQKIVDEHIASHGATINGSMTSKSASTITEDAAKDTLAGHLNLVDADHGEDQFTPDPHIAGTYGHLELTATGYWVYHLDNSLAATNSLSSAHGGTETFTIHSPDNTASHTITINVNGVDDPLTAVTSPASPPPVQHDEPDFSADTSEDISVTFDDVGLVVLDSQHQAVNDHPVTGAAAYLDALGITPVAPLADVPEHQLPADMDIVMAEADHVALGHDDVSHLDLSDALEQQGHEHDHNQQDNDESQHHLQVDDLPDIDPNS